MVEGEGVEKMMGEGDGEEKDTALLLNLIREQGNRAHKSKGKINLTPNQIKR